MNMEEDEVVVHNFFQLKHKPNRKAFWKLLSLLQTEKKSAENIEINPLMDVSMVSDFSIES